MSVPQQCYDYPIRQDFLAQICVPRDMTTAEAERLMAFIMALAKPDTPTKESKP